MAPAHRHRAAASRILPPSFLRRVVEISSLEGNMSDEEHHFEPKADAGASKTYPQQAGTIRKNGYIVIKGRLKSVQGNLWNASTRSYGTSHSSGFPFSIKDAASVRISLMTSFAEEQGEEIATL